MDFGFRSVGFPRVATRGEPDAGNGALNGTRPGRPATLGERKRIEANPRRKVGRSADVDRDPEAGASPWRGSAAGLRKSRKGGPKVPDARDGCLGGRRHLAGPTAKEVGSRQFSRTAPRSWPLGVARSGKRPVTSVIGTRGRVGRADGTDDDGKRATDRGDAEPAADEGSPSGGVKRVAGNARARKDPRIGTRSNGKRGEPSARQRDATGPHHSRRRKPSRRCETAKTERDRSSGSDWPTGLRALEWTRGCTSAGREGRGRTPREEGTHGPEHGERALKEGQARRQVNRHANHAPATG